MRYKYGGFACIALVLFIGILLFFAPKKQGDISANRIALPPSNIAQHTTRADQINQAPANVVVPQGDDNRVSSVIASSSSTSWATRTLPFQGKMITYEFGRGNPPEVALTGAALDEYRRDPSKRGYMTPEAEIAMDKFLSSNGLSTLQSQCRTILDQYNSNGNWAPKYPSNISLESMMYIDSETGRKEFQYELIHTISIFWNSINNPLSDPEKRTWHTCLDPESFRQVESAMELYFDASRSYNNPL